MRVLQVINSLASGGAEVFVAQLSIALQRRCEVSLFTYCGAIDQKGEHLAQTLADAGIMHHTMNCRNNLLKVRVPLHLADIISEQRPDVVHVHLDQSELFCTVAAHCTRHRPVFVRTLHLPHVNRRLARWLSPYLLNFYDYHIGCSAAVHASTALRLPADRSTVITNGVDLTAFILRSEARATIRASLGLPNDRPLIVNVGAMRLCNGVLHKAQDILLHAFAHAGLARQARLVLLGYGTEYERIRVLADSLGLSDAVSLPGMVTNINDYLLAADLMVMPSRVEGLPIAGIEAVCAGLPMLVSDITPFSIFDGPSICRCQVESVPSLSCSLTSALHDLPKLRTAAEQEKSRYHDIFDINAVADRHFDLYGKLLPSR